MLFKHIKANQEVSDQEFDLVYPGHIRKISELHFTSVKVAKAASEYLSEKSKSVLDIGAGAGKFCMIGSVWGQGRYVGVEQRSSLCDIANSVIERYQLEQVDMVNTNITDVPFRDFKAFYFFNSFHENICTSDAIDHTIPFGITLYQEYSVYVKEQLDVMPTGTRLVTYHSYLRELPNSYVLKHSAFGNHLKFWERR
ncbi:MAG: class I SAM-dependent methyltransferase [Saprospiraceae bacterium]|nr:class I SAM-dependent methyltransferase [Saprospiraceae bacterium]